MNVFFQGLSTGNPGSWILFIVLIIVFVVVVLIIRLLEKWLNVTRIKVKKITTPFGSAEFQQEGKGQGEGVVSPHARCIHSKDIIQLLMQQRTNTRKADKVEMIYIYRDLMNCAQDVMDIITARMEAVFLILLHENREGGVLFKDDAYQAYKNALELMKRDVLKLFLKMARENNFIKREEEGTYEEYRDRKAETLLNFGMGALNKYYIGTSPSQEEIYARNREVSKDPRNDFDILGLLKGAIDSMKELSKTHHANISKLENEIDEQVARLFNSGQDIAEIPSESRK